jgi:hypothetical protein
LNAAVDLRRLRVIVFSSATANDSDGQQACYNNKYAACDKEHKVRELVDLTGRRGQRFEGAGWAIQDSGLRDGGTEEGCREQHAYMRRQTHQFRRPVAVEDNAIDVPDFVCSEFASDNESP